MLKKGALAFFADKLGCEEKNVPCLREVLVALVDRDSRDLLHLSIAMRFEAQHRLEYYLDHDITRLEALTAIRFAVVFGGTAEEWLCLAARDQVNREIARLPEERERWIRSYQTACGSWKP